MRTMTEKEQEALLDALSSALWSASMTNMDDVCYGSIDECEKSGKELRAIEKVISAVPQDIRDSYNASLRKKKADKLRSHADAIERGDQSNG